MGVGEQYINLPPYAVLPQTWVLWRCRI